MSAYTATVGIVGYGHLGRQLARGLSPQVPHIWVSRKGGPEPNLPDGVSQTGNRRLFRESEVIFLAVKPRTLPEIAEEVGRYAGERTVVSMMAGIREETLERAFPGACVVRAMTSIAFGRGAALSAVGHPAVRSRGSPGEVDELLRSGGGTLHLPSSALNAYTTVYACGIGWMDALIAQRRSLSTVLEAMEGAISRFAPAEMDPGLLRAALERSYRAEARDRPPGALFELVATPGGMTSRGWETISSRLSGGAPLVEALCAGFRAAQRLAVTIDPAVRAEVERLP